MQIIGNKFSVDFGMAKAILDIQSATSLAFTITEGPKASTTETVAIKLTKLRPKLFLLTWKEANGNTITQIQDHANGKVYMNWTRPDGEFINMPGTIKPL